MTITLTSEEAQQVLDAMKHLCLYTMAIEGYDREKVQPPINLLKARLAQPENEFNPDWDAMAVMVEEQQRMAKQIEELDIALAEQDAKYLDAIEILDDEGWTWDGDQWQRPATRSKKMREAGITRRPKGWSKEDEPEPVAWFSKRPDNTLAIKIVGKPTEGDWEPLYTAPPQREWQGLTDEEVTACWKDGFDSCEQKTVADLRDFIARAIEAKLKEKNT